MSNVEKDKKFKQKFKNIFDSAILNATWEKDGMEVSFNLVYFFIINKKDNIQKRQIFTR